MVLFILISCGSKERESNDFVFMANVYLSENKCDLAITELSKVDPDFYDFYYYQALASAKACKASYSVLDFIDEVENFDSSDSFFAFLAGLETSNETTANAVNFTYLENAINTILFLNATDKPKFSDRATIIKNNSQNEEIGLQALLMIFTYLGKWLDLYGATNADGVKGTSSLCLLDYKTEAASFLNMAERIALLGTTGTCKENSVATSPLLPFGTIGTKNSLCSFIVYFNHIRDLTGNITLSGNSSMGDLGDAFSDMETYVQSAEVAFPGISSVLTFYNNTACLNYYDASNTNKKNIHAFMAGIVDKNFQ